jgi:hypothetical protein
MMKAHADLANFILGINGQSCDQVLEQFHRVAALEARIK